MSVFGERLESRRVGTQKKFAQSLGIPLNTYTNLIRGIRKPDMDAIIKLCTQLSVSADWLLGLPDRSGGAVVTGGVRAGLLYVPEDGNEARALECYLPYSVRYDHPAATAQTALC